MSTKDEVQIDEDGNETRLPVEERPPKRIRRLTTFGWEEVEVEVDDRMRKDQNR